MKKLSKKNLLSNLLALTVCATSIHATTLSSGSDFPCNSALAGLNVKQSAKVIIDATAGLAIGTNASTGAKFEIQITRIRTRGKEIYLHSLEPLNLFDHARLYFFVTESEGHRKRVILPPEMNSRIIAYLKAGGAPSVPFDCNCFAHFMNGKEYEFNRFSYSEWQIEEYSSEKNLVPGSTILIGHDRTNITHLAIFLGSGFYLSKFGTCGPLIVTTLDQMKKGFGGNVVFVARPV